MKQLLQKKILVQVNFACYIALDVGDISVTTLVVQSRSISTDVDYCHHHRCWSLVEDAETYVEY